MCILGGRVGGARIADGKNLTCFLLLLLLLPLFIYFLKKALFSGKESDRMRDKLYTYNINTFEPGRDKPLESVSKRTVWRVNYGLSS